MLGPESRLGKEGKLALRKGKSQSKRRKRRERKERRELVDKGSGKKSWKGKFLKIGLDQRVIEERPIRRRFSCRYLRHCGIDTGID